MPTSSARTVKRSCSPIDSASRAEVDRLHAELKRIGATIVSPPRQYPEYTPPGYYALFFKDPGDIKYEIVCTTPDGA